MDISADRKGKAKEHQPPATEENWPLSMDKQHMQLILARTHVEHPFILAIPVKMRSVLPKVTAPVHLDCGNKIWKMRYYGNNPTSTNFDATGWKAFATANKLKVGDGCVFELTEISSEGIIKFKVQILDGEIPDELLNKCDGGSKDNPIDID
ncbi:hypothetical protein ACHQM5_027760 [Ranunculus cassubicifolius]